MPFSASLLLHLRRLARARGARLLAGLLAFALIANALVVTALPAVASAPTASANTAHGACAQHAAIKHAVSTPAPASHRHPHADDCLCCVGKACACGPFCGAPTFIAMPLGMSPAQAAIAAAAPPRTYATLSPRLLRPPIV